MRIDSIADEVSSIEDDQDYASDYGLEEEEEDADDEQENEEMEDFTVDNNVVRSHTQNEIEGLKQNEHLYFNKFSPKSNEEEERKRGMSELHFKDNSP